VLQEKEEILKSRGQLHNTGGLTDSPGGQAQGVNTGRHRSPPPGKRDSKKCETPLKHELVNSYPPLSASKLKIEPGDSPEDCGLADELASRRLIDQNHSPGKESLLPSSHAYLGKDELSGHLLSHVHMSGMSLEPSLQQMADVAAGCNNFSVDSLMTTTRDGSPDPRVSGLQDMTGYSHYSPCLYPTNSSIEELSNMTAGCLPQSLMSSAYSRSNWYSMPGGHSPTQPDHSYQPREYFEGVGKPPSPGACTQAPYRTPPYRSYYPHQDCEKY